MNEPAIKALLEKLGQFRGSLSADERELLDGILLAACGRQADVQAYSLDAAAVQQAALGAVVGFGLFMGTLGAAPTAQAQIAELEAPASHPAMVSAVPASLLNGITAPSMPYRDDNKKNPRPRP